MAENSKIVYFGEVLIDLTSDTVEPNKVLAGFTFHDKTGASQTGTCTFNADTSSATITASDILSGKIGYGSSGLQVIGTMPNNGSVTGTISTVAQQYTIPMGYHDGSGKVSIDSVEQAKIIESNIKLGVTILGVTGTLEPSSDVTAQSKTVTPTKGGQTVLPDEGTDYLSQVIIEAIPYNVTVNPSGGNTITIGA